VSKGKRRIKLILEYDGCRYAGWQVQPNALTVQEVVESAASQILRHEVKIVGAGRTDAGVHARGMCAHFDTVSGMTADKMRHGINAVLPKDVAVIALEDVDDSFHARYSASSREYSYSIVFGRHPLRRSFAWEFYQPLDVVSMFETAQFFEGTKDFYSFSKEREGVRHFYCHVFDSRIDTVEDGIVYRVRANRFLYGMVRALVGTLVDVGRKKRPPDDVELLLNQHNRNLCSALAPACGLVFESVRYDESEHAMVRSRLREAGVGSENDE